MKHIHTLDWKRATNNGSLTIFRLNKISFINCCAFYPCERDTMLSSSYLLAIMAVNLTVIVEIESELRTLYCFAHSRININSIGEAFFTGTTPNIKLNSKVHVDADCGHTFIFN